MARTLSVGSHRPIPYPRDVYGDLESFYSQQMPQRLRRFYARSQRTFDSNGNQVVTSGTVREVKETQSIVRGDHETLKVNSCTLLVNHCRVFGDNNYIIGHGNRICGQGNTIDAESPHNVILTQAQMESPPRMYTRPLLSYASVAVPPTFFERPSRLPNNVPLDPFQSIEGYAQTVIDNASSGPQVTQVTQQVPQVPQVPTTTTLGTQRMDVSTKTSETKAETKMEVANEIRDTSRHRNDHFGECVVCLDALASVVLHPCKHLALCDKCVARTLQNFPCPVCKSAVKKIERGIVLP